MRVIKRLGWLVLLASLCGVALAAEDLGSITKQFDSYGFMKPIPVAVTGYAGESDSVLKFDLSFMGFELVAPDKATFTIQKNNAAGVGALIRQLNPPYNKAFTGGSTRQQTHALADDIAKTITGKPGIAQTRIAFKVQPTGYGDGEIYISDFDGFNASAVTRDNVICAAPSWAGREQLFYMSHKISGKPDVLSHNLSTGARKAVARFPGMNSSPAVSPDGRHVALILSKSGSPNLYVMDVDGGNVRQLTKSKEGESSPCWSPDGRRLCFTSRKSGRAALYTISADGGEMSSLAAGIPSPTEPDWSPDGKFIICTGTPGGAFTIYLLPMEGPKKGQAASLTAGEDPVWAPNSRAVMFARNVNHRHVLALLDVPTQTVKEIGRVNGDASQPSWAR
jgi:TolB protein